MNNMSMPTAEVMSVTIFLLHSAYVLAFVLLQVVCSLNTKLICEVLVES